MQNNQQIQKKIENLTRVLKIVEVAKLETIKHLKKANKVASHHHQSAQVAKEIMNFAWKKLSLQQNLQYKYKNTNKKLWIYFSIPTRIIKISHQHLSRIIKSNFTPNIDDLITFGAPAKNFAQNNNLEILSHYEELKDLDEIIAIINHAIMVDSYCQIAIVAMQQKSASNPFIVFPIVNPHQNLKELEKYKFYDSLINNFDNIALNYVSNIVTAIYQEAYLVSFREKLLKHENAIKTIKNKIFSLQNEQNKYKRKIESEEQALISIIAKE